jgi:hypothetical protein
MQRRRTAWTSSYDDLIAAARGCGIHVRGRRCAPTRPGRAARPATNHKTRGSRRVTSTSRGDPDDPDGPGPLAGRFDCSAEGLAFP